MAGTLTLSGFQSGTPEGSDSISLTLSLGSVDEELPVTLANGSNTITVPAGSLGVLIIPPASNTTSIMLAASGVPLSRNSWSLVQFDQSAPPASFVVVAGAAFSQPVTFKFF